MTPAVGPHVSGGHRGPAGGRNIRTSVRTFAESTQNETDGPAAIQQTPFRKFTDAVVVVVVVAGCIRRVRLSRRRRLRRSVYYCHETLT